MHQWDAVRHSSALCPLFFSSFRQALLHLGLVYPKEGGAWFMQRHGLVLAGEEGAGGVKVGEEDLDG